jgi:uncharacterized protein (TIGR03435 family)
MQWLIAFLTLAQSQFDVVSVKPSAPDDHNSFMMRNLPGGTVRFTGIPLRMLIMSAYDVKVFQISGGPDWIRTDRWDIQAKVDGFEGRLTMPQQRPMLEALLADRFQLKIHKETKEMPVYALIVDRKGSKLVPHTAGDSQIRSGNGSLNIKKGGMTWLVFWLSQQLGRVVIDQTGLNDEYDYAIEWTPDPGQGGAESIGLPPEPPRPRTETNGPSIFTALQEQLGLRLVSQKGPVEIVVIDRVEKPSAN